MICGLRPAAVVKISENKAQGEAGGAAGKGGGESGRSSEQRVSRGLLSSMACWSYAWPRGGKARNACWRQSRRFRTKGR